MVPLAVKPCLRQVGEERSCGRGSGGRDFRVVLSLSIHAVPLVAGPVSCGPVVLHAEVLLKGRGGGVFQQLGPVSHCVLGCSLGASIRWARVKLSAPELAERAAGKAQVQTSSARVPSLQLCPSGSHSPCCNFCCYSGKTSQSLLFPGTVMKYSRLGTLFFATGSHVVKLKM